MISRQLRYEIIEERAPVPLPTNWADSLDQFYKQHLEIDTVLELVDVAGRSKTSASTMFRYFCGCCWRVLKERQQIARDLIESDNC